MSWVAVGAAVASALVGGYNQAKTAKKQDRFAAEGIRKQAEEQRKANAKMNEQLDTLEKSKPDDEFLSRSSAIRDQLRRKQALGLSGITNTGGGDAVTSMAEAGRGKAIDYGDFINEAVSGIDAPALQRQGESFLFGDTESALNRSRRDSAQTDYLTRLKVQGVRPNPLLSMLSTGLSAYSQGAAGGFGGKTMAGGAGPQAGLGGMSPQTFYGDASNLNALPNMPRQHSGSIFSIFGP